MKAQAESEFEEQPLATSQKGQTFCRQQVLERSIPVKGSPGGLPRGRVSKCGDSSKSLLRCDRLSPKSLEASLLVDPEPVFSMPGALDLLGGGEGKGKRGWPPANVAKVRGTEPPGKGKNTRSHSQIQRNQCQSGQPERYPGACENLLSRAAAKRWQALP